MSHGWHYTMGFIFGLMMAVLFAQKLTATQEGFGVFLIVLCGNLLSSALTPRKGRA